MADLVITVANVIDQGNADVENGRAGATILAGQLVYKEAATNTFKLSDSNSATPEVKNVYGIALHAALAGQRLAVQKGGDVSLGAILTAGITYALSETPGGIQPIADQTTGEHVALIGTAKTTSVLNIRIYNSGVTL